MTERRNAKIIAIVGMSGAGKSTITDYLTEKGYPKVAFGTAFLNTLKGAGLEPTPENEAIMREKLAQSEESDVVVEQIVEQIDRLIDAGQHRIVVDGLGHWLGYKVMKHEFPAELTTVAVTAPRRLRHRRVADRLERPLTASQADKRDYDEIEVLNKGGVIAIADYFVPNEGSLEELHKQIDAILEKIEF